MSTRETVLAAIATTLASVAGGRVYRSRQSQLTTLPAIVIEPQAADASETVLGKMDHRLAVAVRVYARGDTPDTAADAVLEAAWTALAAATDLGLGNEVQISQSHSVAWDFGDDDLVRATLTVDVIYRTSLSTM